MATTISKYTHAHKILCGAGDFNSDTIKIALVTSAYTFNAAHTAWASASGSELASGDGYTTGGETLTCTIADTKLDCDDVVWTFTGTKTFRAAIIYIVGTIESITNPMLFYILFDDTPSDVVVPSVDFRIIWDATGLSTL